MAMATTIIFSGTICAIPFAVYVLARLAVAKITPPKFINDLFKLKP